MSKKRSNEAEQSRLAYVVILGLVVIVALTGDLDVAKAAIEAISTLLLVARVL